MATKYAFVQIMFYLFYFFLFVYTGFHTIAQYYYVDQAGFTLLSQPSVCWDSRHEPP